MQVQDLGNTHMDAEIYFSRMEQSPTERLFGRHCILGDLSSSATKEENPRRMTRLHYMECSEFRRTCDGVLPEVDLRPNRG